MHLRKTNAEHAELAEPLLNWSSLLAGRRTPLWAHRALRSIFMLSRSRNAQRALRSFFVFAVVVSGFHFRETLRLTTVALAQVVGRTSMAQPAVKQAVIETAAGTVVVDLAADVAPNQVAYFIQTAQQGAYDGTTFHR